MNASGSCGEPDGASRPLRVPSSSSLSERPSATRARQSGFDDGDPSRQRACASSRAGRRRPCSSPTPRRGDPRAALVPPRLELRRASRRPTARRRCASRSSAVPDVVVLDVRMPKLDGYEVTRLIRQHAPTCETPVILLDTHPERIDTLRGFAAGADDYLTKPLDPGRLLARVAEALDLRAVSVPLDAGPPPSGRLCALASSRGSRSCSCGSSRTCAAAPLFEDEAVAGLVGARPAGEILGTVLWDRGGSPLHFLLVAPALRRARVAPTSLRSALGRCRRADGRRRVRPRAAARRRVRGRGRRARLRRVGAARGVRELRADVRAPRARGRARRGRARPRAAASAPSGSAALALAAGWLLPASHPYGGIVLAVEVVVPRASRCGRRALWPVVAVARRRDRRSSSPTRGSPDRFRVGARARERHVATPHAGVGPARGRRPGVRGRTRRGARASRSLLAALGRCCVVAARALVRRLRPRGARRAAAARGRRAARRRRARPLAAPPRLRAAALGRARRRRRGPDRGASPLGRSRPSALGAAPRSCSPRRGRSPIRARSPSAPRSASARTRAAPAAWLRARVGSGDVLFPYSSVFLAALPRGGRGASRCRAPRPRPLADTLRRAATPGAPRRRRRAARVVAARRWQALARRLGPRFRRARASGPGCSSRARARTRRAPRRWPRSARVVAARPARAARPAPAAASTAWLGLEAHVLRQASSQLSSSRRSVGKSPRGRTSRQFPGGGS